MNNKNVVTEPKDAEVPPVPELAVAGGAADEAYYPGEGGRRALWISMVVGIAIGGLAFAYKVVEFLLTMQEPAARGFAEVPVTVYFFVAGGWLCLLVWSHLNGKLRNLEETKLEMLAREEEYERQGW